MDLIPEVTNEQYLNHDILKPLVENDITSHNEAYFISENSLLLKIIIL